MIKVGYINATKKNKVNNSSTRYGELCRPYKPEIVGFQGKMRGLLNLRLQLFDIL